tara:strand:- start:3468 stop:4265 length:798 start_codon:yes stop_codon:yes gene_type:complete
MNQVATKKETLPSTVSFEEHAGQGSEYVTARDTKLPILKLMSNTSPVLNPSDAKYNESAKLGDIYNEITNSLYRGTKGVLVVPCLYVNTFNEWADRGDSPGRPIQIHRDSNILRETQRGDDGRDRLPNGNYVEDTGNHFVYLLDDKYNAIEQALITMKSTQKKKSKLWNSMIQSRRLEGKSGFYTPPSWGTVYRLTTVQESNSKGSWPGWSVAFDSFLNKPEHAKTVELTKDFYKSAMESDIFGKVDFDAEKPQAEKKVKEDVPF